MRARLGHAAIAILFAAGIQPASAQLDTMVASRPLALTPTQRTIIYRTIIPQSRGRQPIVREQIVVEPVTPPAAVGERVVAPIDAYAYGATAPAPGVRAAPAPDAYSAYAYVGARVPAAAPLATLPPRVVVEVPAVRSYRYLIAGERVLLVDADGIVVADVTP